MRSKKTGRERRPQANRKGYLILKLGRGSGLPQFTASVHALVAEAFICPRPPGMTVNHMDGNKLNNHVSNLEWLTARENNLHARNLGLYQSRCPPGWPRRKPGYKSGINQAGEANFNSRLTAHDVEAIRAKRAIKTPVNELAAAYGVSTSLIYQIARGARW